MVEVLKAHAGDKVAGEGTAAALAEASGGRLLPVRVTGPVGAPVDSAIALLGGSVAGTAVVEMAAAAGLRLVPKDMRDPTATTTAGVGELVRAALDAGARRILVGCGDSGTSDGGAGALRALGAKILDAEGRPIPEGGGALAEAARLDLSGIDPRLEARLRELRGFEELVVAPCPSEQWGRVPVAVLASPAVEAGRAVPAGPDDPALLQLRRTAGELGRAFRPAALLRLRELPRLPGGKPDRVAIAALAARVFAAAK